MHHRFPDASVSILVRKGNEGIYKDHPFLKETLVWDKTKNKLKHLFLLLKKIRNNRYDCVINCHRYASSGFLTAFSGASHTAGFKQNPFSFLFNYTANHRFESGLHETQRYHELVSDFVGPERMLPKLYPSEQDKEAVASYLNTSFVCLAPASVWFTKQLPLVKWVELCDKLPETIKIYLLGAPGDHALCSDIIQKSTHRAIVNLSGKLSLLQSCFLMQHARMNYVNDSAPLHLASSVNAPVTAFFLSTVSDFGFGPLSGQNKIAEVKDLSCRPCGLHGYKACPKRHFKCGSEININQVLN